MTTTPAPKTAATPATAPGTLPTATEPAKHVRAEYAPIRFGTVLTVELRKMFDTRSGFWLLASIGILSLLASGAVLLFAPDAAQNFGNYASAIGIPMGVILPIIAALSVTSEWSQRTGLTTFTLVPSRSKVILAKLVGIVLVGVASMIVALAVGALGNVLGATVAGLDVVWGVSAAQFGQVVLAQVLGMLVGFMLGVVFRNSAAAIVGYFVFSFVLPTLSQLLYAFQDWYADIQGWVDFGFTQTKLFDSTLSGTEWGQLAFTGFFWLVLPTAFGLWRLMRSEVK